jgi:NitT/TauT family transport system substrate-binding protein
MKRLKHTIAVVIMIAASNAFTAHAQDNASLTMDWVLNGTHAGYFIAQEKGFYKDAKLNVTISRGFGSGDTIKRVGANSTQFGIADTGAVIAGRANEDIPVRIVAMIYDRASLGIIFLKDSGIKQPKDLEGKTLARSASGASVNMFPGFLKANSVARDKITEVVVDGATFLPLLLSGRAHAVLEQTINIGKFSREAAKHGKEAASIRYSDFGLEAYGNGLITHPNTLQNQPDLVRRVIEASLRGIAYALENPDEAIVALRKSNPEINAEGAKDELLALKETQSTEDVSKHGLGYISRSRMEATRNTVTEALSLKKTVAVEDIYTDQFLPNKPITFKK